MTNTTLLPVDTVVREAGSAFLSQPPLEDIGDALRRWFGTTMLIFDSEDASLLVQSSDQPFHDLELLATLAKQIAHGGTPGVVAEDGPLMTYAIPVETAQRGLLVAVATFVVEDIDAIKDWSVTAGLVGLNDKMAEDWTRHQRPTTRESIYQLGSLVAECLATAKTVQDLRVENQRLWNERHLPEKSLRTLGNVVAALQVSKGEDVFYETTLKSLATLLPAEGLALVRHKGPTSGNAISGDDNHDDTGKLDDTGEHDDTQVSAIWHQWGNCPVNVRSVVEIVKPYENDPPCDPIVLDAETVGAIAPSLERQRQILLVPIRADHDVIAWLLVVNPVDTDDIPRVDRRVFDTLARLLAVHDACFADVYWNSEEVTGLVHSLTSVIDAKDPYTCGHSDRVARISVRLGQQLGFDTSTLKTLYLSGLLHDIGKIGIDDAILTKPGSLTQEEYEHIKSHTVIGYNIVLGMKSLREVLPAVRHHHESWDGKGYPDKLAGEEIPLVARIVAVADSYDAMSSTRPYRDPLSEERLFNFLRRGAGKQWDAQVVEAFFAAVDDVRAIVAGAEDIGPAPRRATQLPLDSKLRAQA